MRADERVTLIVRHIDGVQVDLPRRNRADAEQTIADRYQIKAVESTMIVEKGEPGW